MSANGVLYTKLYEVTFKTIDGVIYPRAPTQKLFTRQSVWPERNGYCHWCGKELIGRRKSYCSDKHRIDYYFFFSWKRVRLEVYELAEGLCSDCGIETYFYRRDSKGLDWCTEIDHIKPISKGGNFWDLNNLQLLCHDCHTNIKTRRDLYPQKRGFVTRDLMEFFKTDKEDK